jgi:hypothetical protein
VPQQPLCCGLTWISTGQLGVARRVLQRTAGALAPYLQRGVKVVGLEPSCTAVFRSDARELLPGDRNIKRLQDQTVTLAELLRQHSDGWEPPLVGGPAITQTHCHQHAIMGTTTTRTCCGQPASTWTSLTLAAAAWRATSASKRGTMTCRWPAVSGRCSRPCATPRRKH